MRPSSTGLWTRATGLRARSTRLDTWDARLGTRAAGLGTRAAGLRTWAAGLRSWAAGLWAGTAAARTAARACARVGGRVYDCLHAAVDADRVDHRLAEDLVAAGPREALAGARVHQAERQRLVVDRDDLGVLTQHDPSEPPLGLHSLQHLRPQPPNIRQPNRTGTGTGTSLPTAGGVLRRSRRARLARMPSSLPNALAALRGGWRASRTRMPSGLAGVVAGLRGGRCAAGA
jgi:hypothetical protein